MTGDPLSVVLADINGDDTFSNESDFNVGYRPRAIKVEDVNGDGKLDVLVGNQDDNPVSVLLNTSDDSVSFDTSSIANATGAHSGHAVDATRPDATGIALGGDTAHPIPTA